jgi:hypothetical protein
MRTLHLSTVIAVLPCLLLSPTPTRAQAPAVALPLQQEIDQLRQELDALRRQYEDRLATIEARLTAIQTGSPPAASPATTGQVSPGPEGAGSPSGALPVYGAAAAGSKIFNPDIAVVGNFLGAAGHNAVAPSPAFALPESEASFQAAVDPYARADFFLSFGESGVNVEEGYLTLPSLPGGLLTRVGKIRAAFGKVNTLHTHARPWTDVPLVVDNLLNGEEGINDAGVSVARLIPNPWIFLEATGQLFRGDSGEVFASSQPGDLSVLGHLRGYHDLSESTNIDLGVSFSRGHNPAGIVDGTDVGRFTTRLIGLDATLRWRPLQRSIYRSFVGRTEFIWSRRDQFGGPEHTTGYYVSGDYQFSRRWFAGIRYDSSGHADAESIVDRGQSLLLTFWPSEFSQVRGQYRRTKYGVGSTANEFLFQLVFSIGVHGAHPF